MGLLVIAEKPSVAKDIATALGGFSESNGNYDRADMVITSARGHLLGIDSNQPKSERFNLSKLPSIPDSFELVPLGDAMQRLNNIRALAKQAKVTTIVNACDAGREGELIFRRIVEYIGVRKPIERMWLKSMTTAGIKSAYAQRRTDAEMLPLADAAKSRAEADWLIGMNGTRVMTTANLIDPGSLVSVGRVQTPTLALMVDRENAIRNFKPRDFFEVIATLSVAAGSWNAKWFKPKVGSAVDVSDEEVNGHGPAGDDEARSDRTYDKATADAVQKTTHGIDPSSVVDTAQPEVRRSPTLFDLTTLQREANIRLGLSAKDTLAIAQALYDTHKVLTYPRTDATHLPDDYADTVLRILPLLVQPYDRFASEIVKAQWVSPKHRLFDSSKVSDHFAIIPTGKSPEGLKPRELAVYDLVVRRFLSGFFPNAEFLKTTRIATIGEYTFRASGSVPVSLGWLAVYSDAADPAKRAEGGQTKDASTLPAIVRDERARNLGVVVTSGKTKPPLRYTEATLLGAMATAGRFVSDAELAAAMKERGIGTPATRANVIEELLSVEKRYVERKGKELHPTDKAMRLVAALRVNDLHTLTTPDMTGEWESMLAKMERREINRAEFMRSIESFTVDMVAKIKAKAVATPHGAGPSGAVLEGLVCKCNGQVGERPKSFTCTSCGLTVWKEICGKLITLNMAKQLFTKGETSVLKGFKSRAGKTFDAALRVGEKGVEMQFSADASSVGGPPNDTRSKPTPPRPCGKVGETCPTCQSGKLTQKSLPDGRPFLGCTK